MEHILHSEICCVSKKDQQRNESLGLSKPPEEIWYPIAIDLTQVVVVRGNYTDDDKGEQVTLHTACDCFTVLGNYEDILQRWLKARDTGFFKTV